MAIAINRKRQRDDEEEFVLFPEAEKRSGRAAEPSDERWLSQHEEGRLAIDVHETDREIVIKSAIAGVEPEHLELFVHNDMLTIRGTRHDDQTIERGKAVIRECHWGAFSRSVILPTEVDAENIGATLKSGILTVRLPKLERSKRIAVREL
jgi:HSP20 family protein